MNTEPEGELHPERFRNPEVNYERRDLSARGVLIFLTALAITLVFIGLVQWSMFRYFAHERLVPQPPATAISTPARELPGGDPTQAFPPPQLQPDPAADLNKFRARQEQTLDSYGFVDKDQGILRIPIDHAMQLLAERGLPTRQPTTGGKK